MDKNFGGVDATRKPRDLLVNEFEDRIILNQRPGMYQSKHFETTWMFGSSTVFIYIYIYR